ncbi:MAG: hypothetical protein ACOC0J_01820 [Myxococcota bacterium]
MSTHSSSPPSAVSQGRSYCRSWRRLLPLLLVLSLSACPRQGGEDDRERMQAPPAPSMPEGWELRSDEVTPQEAIASVEQRLDGKIAALRNTVYEVEGRRIQLNVVKAAGDEDAFRIMESLRAMKTDEALLRRELVVYEFVGDDAALPAIREGRAHLERTLE